jgi:hypothetical protein
MWKWLFGFGGASLGALAGLATSIFLVFACSVTVGQPQDVGVVLVLTLGTVVGCIVAGAVVGAYLASRSGPPKS